MSVLLASALLLGLQAEKPQVDEKAGTVSFAAKVCKQNVYAELKGAVEYVLVNPGGKAYESLFEANVDALALHEGLKKAGAQPGQPARIEEDKTFVPEGSKVSIRVEWKDGDRARSEPVEAFLKDAKTGKPMEAKGWLFTGSKAAFNPATNKQDLQVVLTKNLAGLHWIDGSVLLTNPEFTKEGSRYSVIADALPKEGAPVRIVLQAVK